MLELQIGVNTPSSLFVPLSLVSLCLWDSFSWRSSREQYEWVSLGHRKWQSILGHYCHFWAPLLLQANEGYQDLQTIGSFWRLCPCSSIENSGSRNGILFNESSAWKQNWGFRVMEGQLLVCLVFSLTLSGRQGLGTSLRRCVDKNQAESTPFFLPLNTFFSKTLLFFLFFFFPFFFFKTGFLCSFGACPGTYLVDQAGLELTEICLSLPPECWD